jgi:spore germination protein YaaH
MQINIQDRIRKYGLLYDPISDSSYYQYTNEFGKIFQGWFEDVRSLEKKVNFLKKENLGGIAFFVLGYDNGEIVSKYHSIKKQNKKPEKVIEEPSDWRVQKYFPSYRP